MAALVPKRNVWILDSWRDLILYVGTPLLIIPLFAVAQARWSAQEIYLFVAAFGAMGHHLPGMIRAYGDRALFERFRWRFIITPVFLLVVCVGLTKDGEVVVNDPGTTQNVCRTFPRANVIAAWANSKNTVYLVYPENARIPKDRFGHWDSNQKKLRAAYAKE